MKKEEMKNYAGAAILKTIILKGKKLLPYLII